MKYAFFGLVLAFSSMLLGQVTPLDYPAGRVRLKRLEKARISPWYEENRVVFKHIELGLIGDGMQISGEVVADFDCDTEPPKDANLKLTKGPVMGLTVEIQLYETTSILERDNTGKVEAPRFDPKSWGRPVEGQATRCRTDSRYDRYAMALFTLPALSRPLAPGVYVLVASLNFLSQTETQRQQIKYCSDFWGADDKGINPVTMQRDLEPVMEKPDRHEKFFRQVIDDMRKIEASAKLFLANLLTRSGLALRSPFGADDRNPANFVIWDQLTDRVADVELLENQKGQIDRDLAKLKKDPDVMARKLAFLRRNNPNANEAAVIKQEEEQADRDRANIKELMDMYGGKATPEETRYRAANVAGLGNVLEQIKQFQDYICQRYWVLLDGHLHYGWHSVNKPGNNAFTAVEKNSPNDIKKRTDDLAENKKKFGDDLKAYDAEFKAKLKHYPPEVIDIAVKYKTRSERTNDFDSSQFTKREGAKLVLDLGKWGAFREGWMATFKKQTDAILGEIDTSGAYYKLAAGADAPPRTDIYANTVFPDLFEEAKAQRDDVICNAFAYEYWTRVSKTGMAQEPAFVIEEWGEIAKANPELGLQKFFDHSQCAPGSVLQRYNSHLGVIRMGLKLSRFTEEYKKAVEAKAAQLPGAKPDQK